MTDQSVLGTPHADSAWAIDLRDVAKTYKGKIEALKGISMRIQQGEVFGLLGPNGAGKSTLVKILMTIIKPSRCQGTVLGHPVGSIQVLRRVGYLPEHHRFPNYLTGAQVLDFYAAMSQVPRRARRKRNNELLDLVGMGDWGKTRVSKYSKGMKQRVGIAQALMNDPDIILLDEPTDGVDPVGRRDIRNILAELKARGKTVFLNSHLLSELEMVCDRVAILVQGQVAQQGTIDDLTAGKERYEIQLEDTSTFQDQTCAALLGTVTRKPNHADNSSNTVRLVLPSGPWVECEKSTIRIGTTDPAAIQPIIDTLRQQRVMIRSIKPLRPSLEDLFMEAVDDAKTHEAKAASHQDKKSKSKSKSKSKRKNKKNRKGSPA